MWPHIQYADFLLLADVIIHNSNLKTVNVMPCTVSMLAKCLSPVSYMTKALLCIDIKALVQYLFFLTEVTHA